MIACKTDAQAVRTVLKHSRVVGLPGPRQCGKTIRARIRRARFAELFRPRIPGQPRPTVRAGNRAARRFWNMGAHYHGQACNGAELAPALVG